MLVLDNLGVCIYRQCQGLATERRENRTSFTCAQGTEGEVGGRSERVPAYLKIKWQVMYVTYMKTATKLLYLEKWK